MTSIKKTFQVVDGLKNTPLYVEFGRWCIHRKKLEDHVLLVKHKRSKGPVAGLTRKINISDPLATLLLDVLDTQTINYELIRDCDQADRDFFEELLKRADLIRPLKYQKSKTLMTNDELLERFNVLQGELAAGNDNVTIIREAKEMIKLFVAKGMMDKKEGKELMEDLLPEKI